MNCIRCSHRILPGQGWHRTKKGPHHVNCVLAQSAVDEEALFDRFLSGATVDHLAWSSGLTYRHAESIIRSQLKKAQPSADVPAVGVLTAEPAQGCWKRIRPTQEALEARGLHKPASG